MGAGHSRGRSSRGRGRLARRSGRGWRSGRSGRGRAGRPCCSRSARTGRSGRSAEGVADREQGAVLGDGEAVPVAELGSLMCQMVAAGVPPQAGRSPEFSTALRTSPNASCIRTWCGRASRLPGTSTTPPRPARLRTRRRAGRAVGPSASACGGAAGVAGTAGAGLDQASRTTRAASPVSWFRSACRVYPACPRFFHSRSPRCLSAWAMSRRVPVGVGPDHHLGGQLLQVGRGDLGGGGGHLGLHHRPGLLAGPGPGAWPGCPG